MTPPENLLRRLARINPMTAFFAALALMVAGLFLPGIVGAALLFLLCAGLAALTFTTWPVQTGGTRVVRVALLVVLLSVTILKVM